MGVRPWGRGRFEENMSFKCAIGFHDWENLHDEDNERYFDALYLHPFIFLQPNRVCLRCEKKNMSATRYFQERDERRAKAKRLSKDDGVR